MRKSLAVLSVSVLAMGAVAVFAEAPALNFDRGVNASAMVQDVRQDAAKDASPAPASSFKILRADRVCDEIAFTAQDPATKSKQLTSIEYGQTCRVEGNPPVPKCEENQPVGEHTETIQLTLRDRRPLAPGQVEKFQVCLEGSQVDWSVLEASGGYEEVDRSSANNVTTIVLSAASKPAAH